MKLGLPTGTIPPRKCLTQEHKHPGKNTEVKGAKTPGFQGVRNRPDGKQAGWKGETQGTSSDGKAPGLQPLDYSVCAKLLRNAYVTGRGAQPALKEGQAQESAL